MNTNKTRTNFFKTFIILSFIFNVIGLKAQMNCEIQITEGVNLPVCHGEEISLFVEANNNYTYQWSKNGIVINGETRESLTIEVAEDATYSVKVNDIQTNEECNSEIKITVLKGFDIEFEQTQLTCSNNNAENGQNARVIATASGEGYNEFIYEWEDVRTNPNNPQEAVELKAWKEYYVYVTGITAEGDSCTQSASFTPRAYPNPKLEITSDPRDTIFLQNPYITFGFEGDVDSVEHNSWSWAFDSSGETSTSISEKPSYVYTQKSPGTFTVELNVKSAEYGCDTTFSKEITVMGVWLKIPNVFTPNGDGINDYFIIDNDPSGESSTENNENTRGFEYDSYNPLNDYYITTKLTIFNRWGRIVYKSDDYKNDWDGGNLPDGTYFYVVECIGEHENPEPPGKNKNEYIYQGSVTIFGSGR